MRFIDNLGLAKKLLGILMLGVLLTIVVGAVGHRAVAGVSTTSERLIADEALPALDLSNTLIDFSILRRHMSAAIVAGEPARIEESRAAIAELRGEVTEGLADYEASHVTGEQHALVAEAQAGFTAAMRVWDQEIAGLALRPVQTPADLARLDTLFAERLAPEADRVRAALDDLVAGDIAAVHAGLAEEEQDSSVAVRAIWIGTVIGAVLLLLLGTGLSRRITRPLGEVCDALVGLARNDLRIPVRYTARDEVGAMAQALRDAQRGLASMVETIRGSATTIAGSAEELSVTSRQLAASAEETTTRSAATARSAGEVSRSVATVASATEEMTASIGEISQSSTEAVRVAGAAVHEAEAVNATVSKLGDSSLEIADVVKVITSIAEQTNLLALNATIEAARAGDAGKGFAVVAEEVKQLAQETARATEDISRRIEAIQGDSLAAVEAIGRISVTIEEVNSFQTTIAAAVEEQTATTGEMARSVSGVAEGSREIAENIDGVASAARQSTQGVREAEQATQELAELSGRLRELVSAFEV